MEYVFGRVRRNGTEVENVKTVGDEHSDLKGAVSVTREYADSHITDAFVVMERYRSDEDSDGKCYDWYIIGSHYRYEDKFTPGIGKTEVEITDLEIGQIEQEQVLTDHDIAIMELQEALKAKLGISG